MRDGMRPIFGAKTIIFLLTTCIYMACYGEQREKKPQAKWHQKLLKRPKSSNPTKNAGSPKSVNQSKAW